MVPYILEDVMALNVTSTLYTSISFSLDCSQHSTAQADEMIKVMQDSYVMVKKDIEVQPGFN